MCQLKDSRAMAHPLLYGANFRPRHDGAGHSQDIPPRIAGPGEAGRYEGHGVGDERQAPSDPEQRAAERRPPITATDSRASLRATAFACDPSSESTSPTQSKAKLRLARSSLDTTEHRARYRN